MDTIPIRKVLEPSDIEKWKSSEAYQDIMGFLITMNDSVRGKGLGVKCNRPDIVISLSNMFDKISTWIDEIIPITQPQRYGNKAFKTFYEKIKQNSFSLLETCLPENLHSYIPQIAVYFNESFGNSTRIDYGTGHELAFIMFLCCLHKIEALRREDSVATVIILFKEYIDIVRKLQTVYKMEPAGSQGVWSLDDYQFIPFIWGSSQLMMNPKITPEMFTQQEVIDAFAKDYLFLACIQYSLTVKTGPFAEHSNQLWNISGVKTWTKINQGLFKMYKGEMLNKFPIIQHVLFGSILSFDEAKNVIFHPAPDMGALKKSVGMRGIKIPPPLTVSTSNFEGKMPPQGCMNPPSNLDVRRNNNLKEDNLNTDVNSIK